MSRIHRGLRAEDEVEEAERVPRRRPARHGALDRRIRRGSQRRRLLTHGRGARYLPPPRRLFAGARRGVMARSSLSSNRSKRRSRRVSRASISSKRWSKPLKR